MSCALLICCRFSETISLQRTFCIFANEHETLKPFAINIFLRQGGRIDSATNILNS